MTDPSPFANWPNLDKSQPPRDERAHILPGSPLSKDDPMPNNTALENFLGGSPLNVAIKLIFMSLVVGALLMWLDLHPRDILRGIGNFIDSVYAMGFGAVRALAEYIVAGAAIVVPVWFVLRLMSAGGKR